tara:strand:- start:2963 stop:3151 length:189 start_codon:yes stop_codon:yes gene_type:complete
MFSDAKYAKVCPIIDGATSESKENNENTNPAFQSSPKKPNLTVTPVIKLPFGWGDGEPPTPE